MKILCVSGEALVGKIAVIKVGDYRGEWGRIHYFDGDYYHIGLWDGTDSDMIFSRDEFTVKKQPFIYTAGGDR